MTENKKFARWADRRLKWEREMDGVKVSRNSEGQYTNQAVYIRSNDPLGFTLNVSEAREVAAAIIAAVVAAGV